MKRSEIQATQGERGLKFSVEGYGEKDWVLIPQELLDDEVGDASTDEARQDWVEANLNSILEAYKAKVSGGIVRKPFDQIVVRREN